jgi:hypothetical protein
MPLFPYYAQCDQVLLSRRGKLEKVKSLDSQTVERINTSMESRKPAYLASILVDTLKECGWTPEDIHFLGVEIINESGML